MDPQTMDPEIARRRRAAWIAALPEALAFVLFVVAWCIPSRLDPGFVRALYYAMLVECIAVPAALIIGFAGAFSFDGGKARLVAIPLTLLAILFFVENASGVVAHGGLWPYAGAALLLAGKIGKVFVFRDRGQATRAILVEAFCSLILIIVVGLATTIVPFPALGLDAATVASLAPPGKPDFFGDRPQQVFALSTIYFAAMVFVRRLVTIAPWEAHAPVETPRPEQGAAGSPTPP